MKIMLICPVFRGIENGIVESFKRLGCDVYPYFFNVGLSERNYIARFKIKLGCNIDKQLETNRKEFNQDVLKKFNEINPDVVYVIQGRWFVPETLEQMKKTSYVALYLWDMVSLFPEMEKTFGCYNQIYSFDKNDALRLFDLGYNAKFKPAGYDDTVYYPLQLDKCYDVSFIGAMYKERVVLLKELIKTFPDINWQIYGEYAPLRTFIKWCKWRFSSDYRYFKNRNIKKEEVNEVYNKSKIVLSIVRMNQENGWSARLPEILGASAFQITNYFKAVEEEFSDCLVVYKTMDELKELLRYYLERSDERQLLAQKGYDKVKLEYTDDKLNQQIINDYLEYKKKV